MYMNVKGDFKATKRRLRGLEKTVIPAATAGAINKTLAQVRTIAARQIATSALIPPGVAKRRFFKVRRATWRRQWGALTLGTRPIAISHLKPRQTKAGVSAGKHRFPGAYTARGRFSKNDVAFERNSACRGTPITIPIDASIVRSVMATQGRSLAVKNFHRELRWRIKKLAR